MAERVTIICTNCGQVMAGQQLEDAVKPIGHTKCQQCGENAFAARDGVEHEEE